MLTLQDIINVAGYKRTKLDLSQTLGIWNCELDAEGEPIESTRKPVIIRLVPIVWLPTKYSNKFAAMQTEEGEDIDTTDMTSVLRKFMDFFVLCITGWTVQGWKQDETGKTVAVPIPTPAEMWKAMGDVPDAEKTEIIVAQMNELPTAIIMSLMDGLQEGVDDVPLANETLSKELTAQLAARQQPQRELSDPSTAELENMDKILQMRNASPTGT